MSSFDGRIIAITGAASGMGLETARLLASRGAVVSLADINEAALKTIVESLPMTSTNPDHMYTRVDVCDSKSIDTWIDSTMRKYGKIDGAVNMAGIISPATPITEMTDERWDREFSVNSRGVFCCLRAQLRAMSETSGSIVSAASTFGQMGSAGVAAYCASKAAVIGLSKTAAKENPHVRVNCVAPGSVDTPMSAGENPDDVKRGLQATVMKRRASPLEVAKVIAFLLSEESSFVTGAVYNVDGGWMC